MAVLGPVLKLTSRFWHLLGWRPAKPIVREVELHYPRLTQGFSGYRVLHLSDLHLGSWLNQERLAAIVDQANDLRPDLIAFTGDFVDDSNPTGPELIRRELSRLKARDGVFSVMGNHDHWAGPDAVLEALTAAGIRDIGNQAHQLATRAGKLSIAGIDLLQEGGDRLDLVRQAHVPADFSLILCHEPDFADLSAQTGLFDLQLSGHSHAGQIALPRFGRLYLPNYARRYPYGLYDLPGLRLYTTSGLGTTGLELRWNAPAEMALLTLQRGE
jgi:hypothetical protein